IYDRIGLRRFIIGYDHHFGRNREGTIKTVERLAPELGYDVHLVEAHEVKHHTVSSTRIRRALVDDGDAALAKSLLGRPYPLRGLVVHGDKKGRGIGYPTANIRVENERKVIPKNGVYAVKVRFEDHTYGGMLNIGVRPTVTESAELRIEVNIFDFDHEIYGRELKIYFHQRIRDEQKFDGLEHLKAQLAQDKADCINVLKSLY
ncbi:MAG: riboflavin biosynthesis protein RibF, partial [Cyclonatronaceae bacterium]